MKSFSNESGASNSDSDSNTSEKELKKMLEPFLAVCNVLATMHESKLCHWDIKRENVLFSKSENLYKVCDFGSCEFAPTTEYTYKDASERHRTQDDMKSKTTPAYRAPEMWDCWRFQKPPGMAADLWRSARTARFQPVSGCCTPAWRGLSFARTCGCGSSFGRCAVMRTAVARWRVDRCKRTGTRPHARSQRPGHNVTAWCRQSRHARVSQRL